jgi:predicted 3-demethylubiquinone-9 3-methyltransferase (glyoxalase superfamily)
VSTTAGRETNNSRLHETRFMASISSQRIHTCLWLEHQAEEAANFYLSIFKNSAMISEVRYPEVVAQHVNVPPGTLMVCTFTLDGYKVMALNGAPQKNFTQAFSLVVTCADQSEVDYYWDSLLSGGQALACGWLTDKFGVSWQIVPEAMWRLMSSSTPAESERVMAAMMQMVKLDIGALEAAAKG